MPGGDQQTQREVRDERPAERRNEEVPRPLEGRPRPLVLVEKDRDHEVGDDRPRGPSDRPDDQSSDPAHTARDQLNRETDGRCQKGPHDQPSQPGTSDPPAVRRRGVLAVQLQGRRSNERGRAIDRDEGHRHVRRQEEGDSGKVRRIRVSGGRSEGNDQEKGPEKEEGDHAEGGQAAHEREDEQRPVLADHPERALRQLPRVRERAGHRVEVRRARGEETLKFHGGPSSPSLKVPVCLTRTGDLRISTGAAGCTGSLAYSPPLYH